MAMTPQITHLTDTLIGVVGLPEDVKNLKAHNGMLTYFDYIGRDGIVLPDGNWQIVGWSTELDEATCAGLGIERIDIIMSKKSLSTYKASYKQTLSNMLRSHGIEGRAFILRKID